jgi:hypothetical protein
MHYRDSFSEGSGDEFVLSDGSRDRHGTRINPAGWDLTEFRKHPAAFFGHGGVPIGTWADVRVAGGKLLGRLVMAKKGSSARLDELRSLVEQGILRAVSVGFEPIEEGKPGDEWEFKRQALLEASLVGIPSNKNALKMARSLNLSDETMSLAFGEQAEMRRDISAGEQAATSRNRNTKVEKTLAKSIEDAQESYNQARDALNDHVKDEHADSDQTETMSAEVEHRLKKLDSLKRAEKAMAARTADPPPAANGQFQAPALLRRPLGVQKREPKPEDLRIRAALVNFIAGALNKDPMKVLEERYPDDEATNIYVRAAVLGATTTLAGWAAELVETANMSFMSTLNPMAVFPRLAALGTSLAFGPNAGAIRIPSRAATPSIAGSFVAEGGAIPVRRLGLTSITLYPHKVGVISYFSREIARYSTPQIESLLREEIQNDTAKAIDALLIDNVAVSTTRPAGLTNGVTPITASTANGYLAILADIQALAAPFDTANAGVKLVLLMNKREARFLTMAPGPDGTFGWASQFMSEFSVLVSTSIPAGTLVMLDAADFVSVAGGAEFEASELPTLHADDTTPLNIGTAGSPATVAAPTISMWQTGNIALRMIMDVTWAMRRSGMVQTMTGADWGP